MELDEFRVAYLKLELCKTNVKHAFTCQALKKIKNKSTQSCGGTSSLVR